MSGSLQLFAARVRAKGVAFCGAVNWAGVLLLTSTFLPLYDALGGSATFAIYAVIAAAGALFANAFVPETKGRSLQEIERQMASQMASRQA